ncbi:MAG: alpha/beta fold hydrolase [Actinomycetota bacterium]
MPYTDTGARIYYEAFGKPGDPLVVLISGGGAQMLSWDDRFVDLLTARGLRVARFDNRDTGQSERFGGESDVDGGYDLADMGDDILAVMDALGEKSAHLVGHSMGGMMAQMVAILHPERVRSLGLLSTIPGRDPRYVLHGARPELQEVPVRVSREEAIAFAEAAALYGPPSRYDPQVQWHRERAALAYDRGYFPEGFSRQWAALLRAPERLEQLREVTVPTLVLHGREDPVLHWCSAVDMAEAMPAAELQVHPEVGHLLPHELWPELAASIGRTVQRGEEHRSR